MAIDLVNAPAFAKDPAFTTGLATDPTFLGNLIPKKYGFSVLQGANHAAWASGTNNVALWSNVADQSGWFDSPNPAFVVNGSTFTVPPGGAGHYHVHCSVYWATVAASFFWAIRVNGISQVNNSVASNDRANFGGVAKLAVGDVVTVGALNNSGVSLTVTAFPGDVNTPIEPLFNCWRFST